MDEESRLIGRGNGADWKRSNRNLLPRPAQVGAMTGLSQFSNRKRASFGPYLGRISGRKWGLTPKGSARNGMHLTRCPPTVHLTPAGHSKLIALMITYRIFRSFKTDGFSYNPGATDEEREAEGLRSSKSMSPDFRSSWQARVGTTRPAPSCRIGS